MKSFFDHHKLLLAPMAGVTDEAFRALCVEQGADLTYTEMVSAKGLSYANEKTRGLLKISPGEKSVAVQIFGHEPAIMAQEAQWISQYLGNKLAYLDINMGCPARKIVTKGDGCALMKDPVLAARIMSTVSAAVEVPVTAKFRRGFEIGDESAVSFALRLQEAGAAALAVHGRYAEQMYRGNSDWSIIAQVKQAVSVPVIGNGDIKHGEDVCSMFEQTACDAFMIGRAAQGNPWLFSVAKAALKGEKLPAPPCSEQRIAMARRHAELLDKREGKSIVRMRKHAMWYFAGLPGATIARSKINSCSTRDDFNKVFDELLASQKE